MDVARLLTLKRSRTKSDPVVLNVKEKLMEAIHEAEAYLFGLVNGEVDSIFAKYKYDYYPAVAPLTASTLFTEVGKYYRHCVEKIASSLPPDTTKQLKFSIFTHLSTHISNILHDPNVTALSMNFVQGLNMDLQTITELARNEDPMLLETFSDTRELVELMMSEHVHEYLDPVVRNRKYPNLRSGDIIPVLEKIKDPPAKRRNFEDMILLLR